MSCTKEDDVELLFFDKTWYIIGATTNGNHINNNDIKALYSDPNTYFIHFNSHYSFSGKLSVDSPISGNWQVDGKKQKIKISILNDNSIASTTLNTTIYNILQKATSYSGDMNNITIKQNNYNYINFSSKK